MYKFRWLLARQFKNYNHLFAVVKADLVSNQNIQSGVSYTFSTNDDGLTNFTGRNAHVTLSNTVLKAVLSQLPPGK